MAPHYTDSEVMAIFMAGAAAATRDGRQSLERMERWTAEEYLGQVNVLVSKGWWSGAVEAETSKTLRTSGEVLWRYYNTNIIPTLRNVVYPTWAALMNKHGYVEVPSGKQLDDTHVLSMSRLKFVIKPVSCDGSLQSIVMCWPCASSILSQPARSTNWKRDVRTVSAPGSYTRSVRNAMLCSFVSG